MPIDTSVWYKKHIGPRLSAPMQLILEEWSDIPSGELQRHLHAVVSCSPRSRGTKPN